VAVEGSARWDHPELGVVIPTDLIDAAEHAAAIVDVERVIFERACRQTAMWREAGLELALAMNLSNAQLADAALFENIMATLAISGLDPHALWLELMETALVEDIEQAADLLHRVEALGVRVAVDNFGIGWASLNSLKDLPVHALKIDRHFVAGVADDHHDAAITRSILSLGKELGMAVIAVGVETVAQDAALRVLGCQFGQGPLYGLPTSSPALS
jgi:EAL domain-containing protein (putative c-di-GMP-specific phosphodiesterase class I)